jgi:hypothetical protein
MLDRFRKWLEGLRFPFLLLIAGALFFASVLIPDAIPFVDEALLAVLTIVLARIRRKPARDDRPSQT